MKLKCNVCVESPTVELSKLSTCVTHEEAHCPECGKLLALVLETVRKGLHWEVVDNSFDKNAGFIPVEIIEY